MINLLTPFVIQRSFATKDLVYIYVYTNYYVPEILRFALDDNLMLTDISSLPYILHFILDDNRD